jgi:polysaccharide deacetylase 2 family uncharacterized protein YibQ
VTSGFLKGALTGTIVAGVVAGTASVLSDPPRRPAPQAGTVEVTPGSVFDVRREDRAAALPDADTRPEPDDPPEVAEPAPGDDTPSTGAAPAPATPPEIDSADGFGNGSVPDGDSGMGTVQDDSPVASDPPSRMPEVPEADRAAQSAAPHEDRFEAPALRRNAAPFTNRGDKPLMAIVLIEAAGSTVSFETLESFPYPLTIALDPGRRGATEAAARYRDVGLEVVLTMDLPRGGAPDDISAALQASLDRVPQAVAVLDGGTGAGPAAAAAPVLARTGHGLVTRSSSPEPARRLLALAGVPVIALHRDLDGQGQPAEAIETALDQAAADPQRGVIVLGRMRADTVRALSRWSGQGGARRVTLAPVSAVLSAQGDP